MPIEKLLATGQYTITDLNDGIDSYSIILTNDNHSIMCNEIGIPKEGEIGSPSCRAKSTIIVKKGDTELTAVSSSKVLDKGEFKFKIDNISSSSSCKGELINNYSFYMKEIYSGSGSLELKIYVDNDDNVFNKSFTWNKTLDGESSKYVSIGGSAQFHYDNKNDTTSTPSSIELEAFITNIPNGTLNWKFRNSELGAWANVVNSTGSVVQGNKLIIDDKKLFNASDFLYIKLDVVDSSTNKTHTAYHDVMKVYDGEDGEDGKDSYTILLSNETHVILCDKDGVPKPGEINSATCNAKSSISVMKGKTKLTAVGESVTPSVGQWKYKIEPIEPNSKGVRINDSNFYLSEAIGNSGKLNLTVYVEGIGPNEKIAKEFTWSKVIEGSNAPYIKINGEQFFKYDDSFDVTPTPSEIVLTADVYNIKSPVLVWQYFNGSWITISSSVGSVISSNTLTINDKKLFGANNSVRIRCKTVEFGDVIYDSVTISKVFDGDTGQPGEDSKTVKITGISEIKYSDGIPNHQSVTLTATPSNYKNPTYKWYRLNNGAFTIIQNNNSSNITFSHSDLNDTNILKVECRENGESNFSFDEFQIIKVYDGIDGDTYVISITNGTRNICYNGRNQLITTMIDSFNVEVQKNGISMIGTPSIKNITWNTKGHFTNPTNIGLASFIPIPINVYDESKLDTQVSVTVNADGRILKESIPISVSKNSTALDWVEEWDGSKVDIGGTYIITPKLFAGKKDMQTNRITGIAIGQDIVNKSDIIGLAIYYENNLIGRINSDPSKDNNNLLSFGSILNKQFIVKTDGRVIINGGVLMGESSVDTWTQDVNSNKNAITVTNSKLAAVEISLDGITSRVENTETITSDLNDKVNVTVKTVDVLYYLSTSQTSLVGGSWVTTAPAWVKGKYMWSKTRTTLSNGTVKETNPACITGESGTDAQYVVVNGEQVFKYVNNFTGTPTPASITLTATKFNISTTGKWQYKNTSGSWVDWTVSGSVVTATTLSVSPTSGVLSTEKQMSTRYLCDSIYDELTIVKVSDGTNGTNGSNGSDGTNGVDGKDAYTVVLTNESHTFAGSTSSALASSTKCEIIAYKGATRVNSTIGSISGLPTGMTAPITNNNSTTTYFSPTVTTSMSTANGILTVPITVDGKLFNKNFTYSIAFKGTNGLDGSNGITYYTWVMYADNSTGGGLSSNPSGKTYIGVAYNKTTNTPSSTPSDYAWSLIKGTDGIPGVNGADGKTYYTWLKYADSPTSGMSDSPANKIYMGVAYNRTIATESTNYNDYSWSLIKGDNGANGTNGTNGITYYTWIMYADNASGGGISSSPISKTYIGVAYNKTSNTPSSIATDYAWSLIKGTDGIPGTNGVDGKTYYTWVKYADSPTTGMSDSPDNKKYVGLAYNKATTTESTNYNDYAWSIIKGDDGLNGQGIASITEEYYLSTSKTTQSGGSWVTAPPIWSVGSYMWTRSKIVYNNPTKTEYTTPVCDSSWEAIDDIQIGGRNLLNNSAPTNYNGWSHWSSPGTLGTTMNILNESSSLSGKAMEITITGTGEGSAGRHTTPIVNTEQGKKYSWSIYVKANRNLSCTLGLEAGVTKTCNVTTEWQKFTHSGVSNGNQYYAFLVRGRDTIKPNDKIFFHSAIAVEGDKVPTWQPSNEDIDASIADAKKQGTDALEKHSDMANDNKITPVEKIATKKEWDIIVSEKVKIVAEANKLSITTEKTNYETKYNNLNSYITPILSNMSTTTDINGVTHRINFKEYYDSRQDLLNAISTKLKAIGDNAQDTADKNTGEITTTKKQLAETITNLEGITNRVSSSETEITKIQNTSSNNLLYNSDFIHVTDNFPTDWSRSNTSMVFMEGYTDGCKAVKMSVSGLTENKYYAVYSPYIIANEGQKYTYSAYVYSDDWKTCDMNASMELEWFNSAGARISTSTVVVNGGSNKEWKRYQINGTAPTGTVNMRIRAHPSRNGVFYFAKPMLQTGSNLATWDKGGDITGITTRLKTAESRITDDAITNTVKNNFYTKADVDDKGYQTESQVQQKVDTLEIKFSQSGGYNLIKNSTGASKDTNCWTHNGTELGVSTNDTIGSNCSNYMYLDNGTTTSESFAYSSRFKLKPSTNYTFIGYFHNYTKCPSFDVHVLSSTTLSDTDTSTSYTNTQTIITTQTTNGMWKKFKATFTTPNSIKSGYVRIDNNGYNSVGTNSNRIHWNALLLVEGEVEVPWSPHPSEVYEGVTNIDRDGIKVFMSDGEGPQGYTVLNYQGIEIFDSKNNRKAFFGENDAGFIDKLESDDVQAPNITKKYSGGITLFVASNATGDGSGKDSSNKCGGIQRAIQLLKIKYGDYISGDVSISVDNGEYAEDINISGFCGNGQIRINLGLSSKINGTWVISSNTKHVIIYGGRTNNNVNNGAELICSLSDNNSQHIYVSNSVVYISGIRAINKLGNKYNASFVKSHYGGNVYIYTSDISRYYYGVWTELGSFATIANSRGFTNYPGIARHGSTSKFDTCPKGVQNSWGDYGGEVKIISSGSYLPSLYDPDLETSTPPPPDITWKWVESTFSASSIKTVTEGSGSITSGKNDSWGQGKYSTYKPHRGFAEFGNAPSDWAKSGRNWTINLTMTRLNTSHGSAGAVPKPQIKEPNGNFWNSNIAYARGDTKTIALPSTIVSAIAQGSMKTLEMWAQIDQISQYSFFNNVSITIKCEKQI